MVVFSGVIWIDIKMVSSMRTADRDQRAFYERRWEDTISETHRK